MRRLTLSKETAATVCGIGLAIAYYLVAPMRIVAPENAWAFTCKKADGLQCSAPSGVYDNACDPKGNCPPS